MAASAKSLAQTGDIDPPALTPKTVEQLLIGEWHGCLRDRWPLMMKIEP
jgi:hypothetical protein